MEERNANKVGGVEAEEPGLEKYQFRCSDVSEAWTGRKKEKEGEGGAVRDSESASSAENSEEAAFASERVEHVLDETAEPPSSTDDEPMDFLNWRFDVDRFERLIARMKRKLGAWTKLVHEGLGDTPTPRELEYDPSSAIASPPEPIVIDSDDAVPPVVPDSLRDYLSLCLCIVFGNGARSFEHALVRAVIFIHSNFIHS